MRRLVFLIGIFSLLSIGFKANGQEARIELGPDQIALNQAFTITLTVQNDRLKSYDNFPDIPGFQKRGTSSSSSTNIINGQISSSQSIIQNYVPEKEGLVRIPPFTMTVNGKKVSSNGKTVKVGPPAQRQARQGRDPFADLFDDPFDSFFGRKRKSEPTEYVDVKDEAFFAVTTDKSEVYLGEGFNMTMAFYIPRNNRAPIHFHDLGTQLTDIMKDMRPANCWEENFSIDNIQGEVVELRDRNFVKYTVYQATYYPLTLEPIKFPSAGLKMVKYKVAKNPSFFGRNRKQDFKTFYSKPKKVEVKELPPHPLKESVSVGNFWLEDKINRTELETGESFNYIFEIKGEGNIASIEAPKVEGDENIDFYDPNIRQNIRRSNGRVMGSKSFSYFGIPTEPGEFDLEDYFNWIYFDPYKETYDTLTAEVTLNVTGESKRNESISSNDLGSFYDMIEFEDNELTSLKAEAKLKLISNIFILIILAASAWIIFKK